jgi:transglutaminase-like putative cysteine protease
MRYDITLSMGYDYGATADHVRTLVRLLPSDIPGRQIVTARLLEITPRPQERHESTDFFGNVMTHVAFHTPIDAISLTLTARVERLSAPGSLDLSPRLAEIGAQIAARADLGPASPLHFLAASPRIAPDPAITAFARAAAAGDGGGARTTRQAVAALGAALHAEMRFDAGATDVDTAPAEAFAARHGVCQDFSHVMIAALRALGVPAGYVSGFLRTRPPPGQPRLEGADAMHAWVRAWCGGDVGWVEYDPTNACFVGRDHISVAQGRDYADVAPVKGALRTVGQQQSHHSVDVVPAA